MPAEHHGGIMMAGKYGNKRGMSRKLEDGAHAEAEDMWKFSAGQAHPASSAKDSIANYISLGQKKNMESIPYNTFKGGTIPHTYQTMSIDQFAEPDSQSLTPLLSPLEFASLMHVRHLMPPDYLHDKQANTFSSGRDDILRAGKTRRFKTSYAKKQGRRVPYQRADRTSSVLGTGGAASKAMADNVAIITDDAPAPLVGTGKNSLVTPATVQAIKRLIIRFFQGKKTSLTDPDILHVMQAGLTVNNLSTVIKQYPVLGSIPGLSTFAGMLSTSYAGMTLGDVFGAGVAVSKAAGSVPESPTP
jgi:hypothetical protein